MFHGIYFLCFVLITYGSSRAFDQNSLRLIGKVDFDEIGENDLEKNYEASLEVFANFTARKISYPTGEKEKPNLPIPTNLVFPKIPLEGTFKINQLNIEDKSVFLDLLHDFISSIHPFDISPDFVRDAMKNGVTVSKLQEKFRGIGFLSMLGACCILALVILMIGLWFCCSTRKFSRPSRWLKLLFLALLIVLGLAIYGTIFYYEDANDSFRKIPVTVETAFHDLINFTTGASDQFNKTLTESLEIVVGALVTDLDNLEELVGKPVQTELASKTGLDVALNEISELAKKSESVSICAKKLLVTVQSAYENLTMELSNESERLRNDLESVLAKCISQDADLCATIDLKVFDVEFKNKPLNLEIQEYQKQLFHNVSIDFGKADLKAHEAYSKLPHEIATITSEKRKHVREQIYAAQTEILQKTRNVEFTIIDIIRQLDSTKKNVSRMILFIQDFEIIIWDIIGITAVFGLVTVWALFFCAMICQCHPATHQIVGRPTFLCGTFVSYIVSIGLCVVLAGALILATHVDMLACTNLEDPNYQTLEAILETTIVPGGRLNTSLKDILRKCEQNESMYTAFHLNESPMFDELFNNWGQSDLLKFSPDIDSNSQNFEIFSTNIEKGFADFLRDQSLNSTADEVLIRGSDMKRKLKEMSLHIQNVTIQLDNYETKQKLDEIKISIQKLISQNVKPLIQEQVVFNDLFTPLKDEFESFQGSINNIKNVQNKVNSNGRAIIQQRVKLYIERLVGYMDQSHSHVTSQIAHCRPLWNIVNGARILVCQDILRSLDGFWFAILLSIIVMMISIPVAHKLASVVY